MRLTLSRLSNLLHHAPGEGPNPERDWLTLLGSALLLLLIIVAWHVWAFETVVGGGTLGEGPAKPQEAQSASALDIVPGLLDMRAAEDANYINGTYRFADPLQ